MRILRDGKLNCAKVSRIKRAKWGGAGGLSKEIHALVQAQLANEAAVRERVGALRAQLLRGLAFVRSVVAGGGTSVKSYVGPIAECLLQWAMNPGCVHDWSEKRERRVRLRRL